MRGSKMIKKIWKKIREAVNHVKDGKHDSEFGTRCNDVDGVDRINELPDEIIVSILSLLPLKEAASTSVLSTRWKELWRHTPNLNIHMNVKNTKYIERVNSVLESHKAPFLKELSIRFKPADKEIALREVNKWIEFGYSRHVEVLKLDFLCGIYEARAPDYVFILSKSTISANLKSLFLSGLVVSDKDAGLLIHESFPLLEQLIIRNILFLKSSNLEFGSSVLKHLDMQCCYCYGGKSFTLSAPNLTSLTIDVRSKIDMSLDKFPKLVHFKIMN